ncbi:hypothetical protein ACHAWF_009163 [Thalassiosira exigua]
MSLQPVIPCYIHGLGRAKLLSRIQPPGTIELEISPGSSRFESLNQFVHFVITCQQSASAIKLKEDRTCVAMMRGVKDLEIRKDIHDPSSAIGGSNDKWDLYAVPSYGVKKVDDDLFQKEKEDCQSLKIKVLKEQLKDLGVEYDTFSEKSEFVNALAKARLIGELKEVFIWHVHEDGEHVALVVARKGADHCDSEPGDISGDSGRMAREVAEKRDRQIGVDNMAQRSDAESKGNLSKQAPKPFYYDDDRMLRDILDYGGRDGTTEWQEVPLAGGADNLWALMSENRIAPNLIRVDFGMREDLGPLPKLSFEKFCENAKSALSDEKCKLKLGKFVLPLCQSVFHMEGCDLSVPLNNGTILEGKWSIYATGDESIITFFAAVETNDVGYQVVAQMGPMPVK